MGEVYSHICFYERQRIEKLKRAGKSINAISKLLGRSYSTVYYELHRKRAYEKVDMLDYDDYVYRALYAQNDYVYKQSAKGVELKIGSDMALYNYIYTHLKAGYSAGSIIYMLKKERDKFSVCIKSVNTIYSYIKLGLFEGITLDDLCYRRKRKKHKVVRLPNKMFIKGRHISERKDISDRLEFGHWEMDLVIGKSTNRKCLLVLTERKTRYEIVFCLNAPCSSEVVRSLNYLERRYGKAFYKMFLSITTDNGSEFSDCEKIEKALFRKGKRTEHYYCNSYASYERGSNENNNKLIRRLYPKGTDFDSVLNRNVAFEIAEFLNNYPRKLFNGDTAKDRFLRELETLKILC